MTGVFRRQIYCVKDMKDVSTSDSLLFPYLNPRAPRFTPNNHIAKRVLLPLLPVSSVLPHISSFFSLCGTLLASLSELFHSFIRLPSQPSTFAVHFFGTPQTAGRMTMAMTLACSTCGGRDGREREDVSRRRCDGESGTHGASL